jgi:hypothetical protein
VRLPERRADVEALGVQVLVVGFSPPEALTGLRRHLSLPWPILSDEPRELYRRLGVSRTGWRHVYTPGTLAQYGRALLSGRALHRPVEDTRQLGADVILVDGTVTMVYRASSPDDRPTADLLLEALDSGQRRERTRR